MSEINLENYKFEDIKPFWKITLENYFEGLSSDEEYTVTSAGKNYDGTKDVISVVYEDEDYQSGTEIDLYKDDWEENKGKVTHIPTEKQVAAITELNSLVKKMNEDCNKANQIAKDNNLEFESVVLDDPASIIDWHSSKC